MVMRRHTRLLLAAMVGLLVLAVGGFNQWQQPVATAEIYDPATGTWTKTGSLKVKRAKHVAALLADGTVLVVGGQTDNQMPATETATAELYDPDAGVWTFTGSLASARSHMTGTVLFDGSVMVAGGVNESSAERYDPVNNVWSPAGALAQAREGHGATLLNDGRVLLTGGSETDPSTSNLT